MSIKSFLSNCHQIRLGQTTQLLGYRGEWDWRNSREHMGTGKSYDLNYISLNGAFTYK